MISVFLAVVILGTSIDVFHVSKTKDTPASSKPNSLIVKILLCFSVYSNGKKILSRVKLEGSIDCIHGIRFFSMCWVVMGHTWFVNVKSPPDNIFDLGDVSMIYFLLVQSMIKAFKFRINKIFLQQFKFYLIKAYSDWIMLSVWSGLLSVDTFFFLSGFLVAYSMTKQLAKMKRRVNILKMSLAMYLHRYIR